MCVEIITTGNELMNGLTRDTNFSWSAAQLASFGVAVKHHCSVNDDAEDLVHCFRVAADRSRFVVVSGGLGPTDDDLCASAASEFLESPLVFNERAYRVLTDKLALRGRKPNSRHRKQAMFPEMSEIVKNPAGTSEGFGFVYRNSKFYFLPGVPREFRVMFSEYVLPDIVSGSEKTGILSVKTLKTFGLGESEVAERLKGFSPKGVSVGYRIRSPEVHIRLAASGAHSRRTDELIRGARKQAVRRLGSFFFAEDDMTLEDATVSLLLEKGLTICFAESCTGGLCADRITNVSGSSGCFSGGVVTYSNDAKRKLLGVSRETLSQFGAVSEQTVSEMAVGARNLFRSDIAVSVSGIAGPSGGTREKPVGTVWFGFSHGSGTSCEMRRFAGAREEVKNFAASAAIDIVRKFGVDYVELKS